MAIRSQLAVCAALALMGAPVLRAQGTASRDTIRAQVLGFYRDDRAHRWPDVLDYFWMGKISARWTPPTDDPRWIRANRVPADSACAARSGPGLSLPMTVTVIDERWARVFVAPRCGGPDDELWMLHFGVQWRIARMIRAAP